ncbi:MULTISPECIES: hypothetical protein [Pseudophaeobacter]|jgi:hypothetical protein|uniref:hypothetical protein n=1 Tax=Pseudophaeobacter TaxID=1541822 RepID=UPI002430C7F2|nr:hypothetical protein [Pseudophaeobacter profundi]
MSANQNLTTALEALEALEDQLRTLQTLTNANEFMVAALKEQGDALKSMEPEPARDLLRSQARERFSQDHGSAPDEAVLSILEQSLGKGLGAEIIPFPGPAARKAD